MTLRKDRKNTRTRHLRAEQLKFAETTGSARRGRVAVRPEIRATKLATATRGAVEMVLSPTMRHRGSPRVPTNAEPPTSAFLLDFLFLSRTLASSFFRFDNYKGRAGILRNELVFHVRVRSRLAGVL